MPLIEQIQTDMVAAMRGKEAARLGALRMAKAALHNKRVETGGELSEAAAVGVLHALVKQRRDAAGQFRDGGREDMARKEEAEIVVLEAYLPAPASDAEIREAIAAAIAETGASSPKDMGPVMKATLARLAGKTVDGGRISRRVRETLA